MTTTPPVPTAWGIVGVSGKLFFSQDWTTEQAAIDAYCGGQAPWSKWRAEGARAVKLTIVPADAGYAVVPVEIMRAIAEGYETTGYEDRFVVVTNPKFQEDDGSNRNLVFDTQAAMLSASEPQDKETDNG